jgi:hypothetical protein
MGTRQRARLRSAQASRRLTWTANMERSNERNPIPEPSVFSTAVDARATDIAAREVQK